MLFKGEWRNMLQRTKTLRVIAYIFMLESPHQHLWYGGCWNTFFFHLSIGEWIKIHQNIFHSDANNSTGNAEMQRNALTNLMFKQSSFASVDQINTRNITILLFTYTKQENKHFLASMSAYLLQRTCPAIYLKVKSWLLHISNQIHLLNFQFNRDEGITYIHTDAIVWTTAC